MNPSSAEPRPHAAYDVAMIVLGALLISSKGIIAKFLFMENVSVDALLLVRSWMALPLVIAWALYRLGPRALLGLPPRLMLAAVLAGVASYYLGAWCDFAALSLIDASLERVLLFTYPVFIVIARAVISRRLPSRRVMLAVIMTYIGVVATVGGFNPELWRANAFGAALVLTAAALFAYYLFTNERVARASGSVIFVVYALAGATLALSGHFFVLGSAEELQLSLRALSLIALMTTITNVLPLLMFSASIRRIGAQRAAIISCIGPPATIALAVWLLGEVLRPGQLLGVVLTIVGIIVLEARRDAGLSKPESV